MNTSGIALVYDYNYWATDRILSCGRRLPEGRFAGSPPPGVSLRRCMVHVLNWETTWRERCAFGAGRSEWLPEETFSCSVVLLEAWHRERAAMRAYLSDLSDESLGSCVQYLRRSGEVAEATLWHLLLHIVLHGAQHRSEAARILTEEGISPGDIDFLVFLRLQSRHC